MTQTERSSRPLFGGSFAVRARRVQFTIRTLMIAVCVMACALAFLKRWPEGLAVLLLLGLPLYGLSVLFGKIPQRRSAWRFSMCVAMLSVIMLGMGWFSARVLIWMIQWQGVPVFPYRPWTYHAAPPLYLAIPAGLTAIGLFINLAVLTDLCCSRRQFALLPLVVTFAITLACGWAGLFGWLASEASI
jgi:hypothetical protein